MKRNFSNIQAMRGVAALMVCLVHSVAMPVGVGMDYAVPFLGAVGPAGVDLFFVISGFIIATVAADAGSKARDVGAFSIARDFALKRMARVYPIYWVVFILAVLASPYIFLAPATVPERPWWKLFLLLDTNNNKVMAAWTLVFELYFYLTMTVLLAFMPRNIFRGLLIWSVASAGLIVYFQVTRNPLRFEVPFSPLLFEFMLGTLVAYLFRRGVSIYPLGAIVTGVLLFAIGAYANQNFGSWQPWQRLFAFGPASALIIYGMVAYEVAYKWTFVRPWQRLGDASYSLYIWHQLLFFGMLAISQKLGLFNAVPGYIIVPTWILIVLGWSFLSFHYLENPFRKWIESKIVHRTPASRSVLAGIPFLAGRPARITLSIGVLVVILGGGAYAYRQAIQAKQAPVSALDATRIEAAMAAGTVSLDGAVGSFGLQPDQSLKSFLDIAGRRADGSIHVQGWAADASGSNRVLRVLAFQCRQYLGVTRLLESRPDVSAALSIGEGLHGFAETFNVPAACESETVEILMVSDDQRFATLSAQLRP